jgi:hypothetical protein
MSRKLMLIAVPTMACLLTLCVVDSSSNAFAKGGPIGRGEAGHGPVVNRGRGFDHNFRHFDRYGWGYGCYGTYGCYGYEVPVCETVTPVCTECEPVVAPVCTTCEPVYNNYGFWGYNHFRKDFHHNPPHKYQPLSSRGSMGRKG